MHAFQYLPVAIGLMLPAPFAWGRDLPRVDVRFHLKEPTFSSAFPGDALATLESRAAEAIEARLAKKIRFLQFGDGGDAHVLHVTLYRQEPEIETTSLIRTFFSMQIEDVNASVTLDFRPPREYPTLIDPDSFHAEIAVRFATEVEKRLSDVVARVLSHISLADEVYLSPAGGICVYPFRAVDLAAGEGTVYVLETKGLDVPRRHWTVGSRATSDEVTGLPDDYRGGVLAEEGRPPQSFRHTPLNLIAATGKLAVRGVFIFNYEFIPPIDDDDHLPTDLELEP